MRLQEAARHHQCRRTFMTGLHFKSTEGQTQYLALIFSVLYSIISVLFAPASVGHPLLLQGPVPPDP